MSKSKTVSKNYYLFDCKKFILGRMSSRIATLLQGKNLPDYAPYKEGNCFIIVINSDKLNVSGKKLASKIYHSFSGYPGGSTSRTLEKALGNDSRKVVWNSIYGMLPKNKLRDKMMKKIQIFRDEKHDIKNCHPED